MPIRNRDDAVEVESRIERTFAASPSERAGEVRALFVEVLDFDLASGQVALDPAPGNVALPPSAERVAELDGVHVLYVALDTTETDRVRKGDVAAAARLISEQLGDDLLLVFTNTSASQLHLIQPSFEGTRPTLRRMIVERDLPRRTAVQQVSHIYWNHQDSGSIRSALDKAFDVEAVTREFFEEYKRAFDLAMDRVEGFGSDEDEQDSKKLFVQTLFNRLMFIYFLSRKGWLTFRGDKDYLNAIWRDYEATDDEDKNFHVDRLRLLFFAGLNNYRAEDLTSEAESRRLIGEPPFLNGGLFDKTAEDDRFPLVPDECTSEIFTKLFDRFNFTVMESTPFDIEVAVDPEMLGKVFEELVTGRHDTGSYYTPRPVVSFMCREALKGYLEGCDTGIAAEEIARFVDERDTSGVGLASAPKVAEALEDVTVVDPACGSGAYLLGMMQELVDLRTALFNVGVNARSLYELKLHIIQRNLYGVDIDEFAVNIAMLRMWLSLVIEYEGEQPEPLPNLDFKVVKGDSLLGPDPSQLNQSRYQIELSDLPRLKARYMRATADKDELRREIADAEKRLREDLGVTAVPECVVDWRIEFAEVFANGGFDVVLANPPYVVTGDRQLREMYKEGVFGRMNTYGLFIQRSLQLMREGSQLVFINPRTLLTDRYFTNLRKVIKQTTELRGVVLIQDRHNTFARVLQECIILHLARESVPPSTYLLHTRSVWRPHDLNDTQAYYSVASNRVMLGRDYDEAFYVGTSEFEYRVFECMDSAGSRLSDLGLKAETGKIQFDKFREYVQEVKSDDSCRLIWAENIQRYRIRESQKRVGKEWLDDRVVTTVSPNITGSGIVTQRTSANEQPRRIIATLITEAVTGAGNVYSENGTNFVSLGGSAIDHTFIIGTINSSPMEYIFRRLNSNVHVSAGEINKLPFPSSPDEAILREIATLVLGLLGLGGVDCEPQATTQAIEYELRLDRLIGSLYGLSAIEVEEIQNQLPSYGAVYGLTEDESTAVERRLGLIHQTDEEEDEALARAMDEALAEGPDSFVNEEVVMATLRGLNGD